MKRIFSTVLALTLATGLTSGATTNVSFFPNQTIPDADANGVALLGSVSGVPGTISSLSVSMEVTNGFNGDLYAYLAGPNGGFAVLLNRVGVTSSLTPFGYGDLGFNVTFADSNAGDVHRYRDFSYTLNVGGQLIGGWRPDGRNLDPASPPSAFGAASPTAMLGSFNGLNPNGTWSLFVADFSHGAQSIVKSWGLNITTVPEPGGLTLLVLGLGLQLLSRRVRCKQ